MKFNKAWEFLGFFFCLINLGVLGCVMVGVNTDGANQPGFPSGCEFDPNTGQVFCADACEKTYEHTVTVARHRSLEGLNTDIASNILEEAQQVAQAEEGFFSDDNVACMVSFRLAPGGLNEITAQDDTVDNEEEYIALMQMPEWVKAVKTLYMCASEGQIRKWPAPISGCSTDYPYKLSLVTYDEQNSNSYNGILWLHEIGHTRGNEDIWEPGDNWVMYGAPTENSRKLTCRECARYLLP